MKLRELASRVDLDRRTIHFYITQGIVKPEVDPGNGYYEFTQEHVKQLVLIRELRKAGIGLKDIRSILTTPLSSTYYLHLHMERLRQERRHMEQTIESLQYILETLPMNPELEDLHRIIRTAGIPEPPGKETDSTEYDMRLVNHFLWRGFLQKEKMTEYQEFLWLKLDRLARQDRNGDYTKILNYLHTLSHEEIDWAYSLKNQHITAVSQMDADMIKGYMQHQVDNLEKCVENQRIMNFWHEHYEDFHFPYLRIGSGEEEGRILRELSPVFQRYQHNIVQASLQTYEWFHSPQGKRLFDFVNQKLGEHMDWEIGNHAMIEYLCELQPQ